MLNGNYKAISIKQNPPGDAHSLQYVRIITDLVCVILGVALFLLAGGTPAQIPTIAGVGTIITAFFMGPLIEFFNVHIARPVLKGKNDVNK